jgi:5-methylcytosine-specific restriction endonuclease McrA
MNRWKIPAVLEREVLQRDQSCIYCGTPFGDDSSAARRNRPSWEHIINDACIVTRENIALCCIGCNASKGTKGLATWLESKYCKNRGISPHTVAEVVQAALARAKAERPCDA